MPLIYTCIRVVADITEHSLKESGANVPGENNVLLLNMRCSELETLMNSSCVLPSPARRNGTAAGSQEASSVCGDMADVIGDNVWKAVPGWSNSLECWEHSYSKVELLLWTWFLHEQSTCLSFVSPLNTHTWKPTNELFSNRVWIWFRKYGQGLCSLRWGQTSPLTPFLWDGSFWSALNH